MARLNFWSNLNFWSGLNINNFDFRNCFDFSGSNSDWKINGENLVGQSVCYRVAFRSGLD